MKRGLTAGDGERLLVLLKADVEDRARELREAGWREDEFSFWRKDGKGRGYALHDAHALAEGRES